jgi:protein-S-isoprenylcysteine O-methyltransferase Ste14
MNDYLQINLLILGVQHIMVCLIMSACFAISVSAVWQDRHDVIITAMAFLYSAVMIHLVLIKRWEDEKKQVELDACKRISAPGTGLHSMVRTPMINQ